MDRHFEGTELIPNTVDRLKQIVRNFRDRRTGVVPGLPPVEHKPSIPTMVIQSYERKLARPSVLGLTVWNQLPRRGDDEARFVLMSIPENWPR